MTSQEIIDLEQQYLAPTYKRAPMVLARGQGVEVWDLEGRRYLDFLAGIAVNPLGHCPPEVQEVLRQQSAQLIHVSNLYHSIPHALLARELCQSSFADRVFFCNTGTEASEGAIKFARKATGQTDFICFSGSFHGRTVGALSMTSNERYRTPFEPLMPGVHFCPFNDLEAVERHPAWPRLAAVVVEPVQGEGGIFPAAPGFLAGLRRLCDERGAVLVFDEVQCGLGRTGHLWAHRHDGVNPDLMTLAKPLGGGLPIGAILMTERVSSCLAPGDHGSTFAGSPLVCAVALRVFQELRRPETLAHVQAMGEMLGQGLRRWAAGHDCLRQVRGRGLMWGVELDESVPVASLVEQAVGRGLLVASSGANTLRLLPPLRIQPEHVAEALERLEAALREVAS